MSDIKQLLEKATRKTEMRWRVLAFDPEQDNKLVHTSKDAFDCIKMAGEYKMDLAKKNPNYIIEIIAESKEQRNEGSFTVNSVNFDDKYKKAYEEAKKLGINISPSYGYPIYNNKALIQAISKKFPEKTPHISIHPYEGYYAINVVAKGSIWHSLDNKKFSTVKEASEYAKQRYSHPQYIDILVSNNQPALESSQKNEAKPSKADLEKAAYSSSFMNRRANVTIDGKTYVKIGKDKWEYNSSQSSALGPSYSTAQLLQKIQQATKVELTESAQKNEAKEYKLYKLKKIGNDKALVGTYPATSMGDALQKRINMRKKNDGFIWEVVEIENGKGKVIDSTEHYTDEFIKNNFKGDHYRNKESAQKNEANDYIEAWDAFEHIGVNVLDLLRIFEFLFVNEFSLQRVKVAEVDKIDNRGCFMQANKSKGTIDFYQNGKLIYSYKTRFNNNKLFKADTSIRPLSRIDKEAMNIGLDYVMNPYGSRSDKCEAYMKKNKINPNIKYIPNNDVKAADYPSLKYDKDRQEFICIMQGGGWVYKIPLKDFHRQCKPETDKDKSRALFISAQD